MLAMAIYLVGCASAPTVETKSTETQNRDVASKPTAAPKPGAPAATATQEATQNEKSDQSGNDSKDSDDAPVTWVRWTSHEDAGTSAKPSRHLEFVGSVLEFHTFEQVEDTDAAGVKIIHRYGKRASFHDESTRVLREILESY
jgi:hypothetical protein